MGKGKINMKANLSVLSCILFICSCSKSTSNEGLTPIAVDVESTISLDLNQGEIIALQTTDSSLLYDISSIDMLDNTYFIRSRNSVHTFDSTGNFLYNIGNEGQGDKEYVKISSFYIDNGELNIHDFSTHRILVFGTNGSYFRTEKIVLNPDDNNPTLIFPLGNREYIARNTFNGTPGYITPALSMRDKTFCLKANIEGRNLTSGSYTNDFVSYNKDEKIISYWELLNDTIYNVKNDEIHAQYIVTFGDKSIPAHEREGKDIYALIEYMNKPENVNSKASMVRFVYEEMGMVYFVFSYNSNTYLTIYNKKKNNTKVFQLSDESLKRYRLAPYLKVMDNNLILALEDMENIENNQSLFIINKNKLNGL